jgi:hypothetical protein
LEGIAISALFQVVVLSRESDLPIISSVRRHPSLCFRTESWMTQHAIGVHVMKHNDEKIVRFDWTTVRGSSDLFVSRPVVALPVFAL